MFKTEKNCNPLPLLHSHLLIWK